MISKIKLGLPNLWLQDSDPFRAINVITTLVPERNYYIIHPEKGFSKYVDETWKPVLIPNPSPEEAEIEPYVVTFDQQISSDYIQKTSENENNITFISLAVGEDVQFIKYQVSRYIYSNSLYRDAFWQNSIENVPVQKIIISPSECPPEVAPYFEVLDDVYPDTAELATVLFHIKENSPENIFDESQIPQISRAGLGFTESEFITTCLTTISETKTLTAKQINDKKMANIKANGILEIINPSITFDNIGGLDVIKDVIKRTSVLRSNPSLAEEYGITPIRRMLMVGVPGTGKSAICQATAAELNLDLARTGISQVMNKYIGQSEENMRKVFKQIKIMNPLCVWIDEFGRDLSGSGQGADSGTTDRVHGEFLTGLQELPEESFLLCAANELHALKPEMLRADRFDKIFFVGLPSHSERKHIFQIHLSNISNQQYDYDALAEATMFMTGAEILSLIKETKFYVISESSRPITTDDLLQRAPMMRNTIWRKNPDMVKGMYEYALEQWDWASAEQMEDAKLILGRNQAKSKTKVSFS